MGFLFFSRAWAVSPQAALRLGDGHALTGSCADQVGFEFRDHGQDVKEETAYGLGRVVNGAADAQLDLAAGEFINDVLCIAQRPGQPVELGRDQGVTGPAGGQRFSEPRPCPVGAGEALVRGNSVTFSDKWRLFRSAIRRTVQPARGFVSVPSTY